MNLSDFDFVLPPELIAAEPTEQRDQSSLILSSQNNRIIKFADIIDYLNPGDLMIFNDSRVINAQLTLKKLVSPCHSCEGGNLVDQIASVSPDLRLRGDGSKNININLNKPSSKENAWRGFARPSKKLAIGDEFLFDNHKIIISDKFEFGEIEVTFVLDGIEIFDFLDIYGEVPLPAYIKRTAKNENDKSRYQTVYGKAKGSVAAPTAGLHFSQELLDKIKAKNIETQFVTLHVGAGTFMPVKVENIKDHKMHSEYCQITDEVALAINNAKQKNRRIVVVGTTAMRTIESFAHDGKIFAGFKETNIFITPGYKFQIADCLITNFHLPKSTLFMLVSAFSGQTEMKNLYQYAINNKMRFFSYGDAMMIERK